MRKFYILKKIYRFLLIIPLLLIGVMHARASLSKGDLAVIGMNGDVDVSSTVRSFAVVALNTIAANETIYITDRGWVNGSPGNFTTSTTLDGTIQWKPSSIITAGTVIIFKLNMASSVSKTISATKGDGSPIPDADISISGWTNSVVTSLPWNNASGDQLLIYQGADSNPSFIFAFNNVRTTGTTNSSGGWSTDPNGVTGSGYTQKTSILYGELPSELANTVYAVGFLTNSSTSTRYPNMSYSPSISSGTKASWLADITDTGKWKNNPAANPFNFGLGFGVNNSTQFNITSGVQAPTVTSVSVPSNATYKIGQTLSFTINFSSDVTVTGTPQLALTIGSTGKNANYVSGSGSSALTFNYPVASGDLDTDGIAIGTLSLNGGTITDASSNNATLTLNNVAPTSNVLVDGVAPSVMISSTAGASGSSTSTSPIPFTVTFSESVTGFVAGDIIPGNATISGFSGSGTTYTFNATPTANGAVTINIAANVAQDAADNGNTAASQFSITYTQAVAVPTVTALSPTSGPTGGGTSVTITGTNFSGTTAVTFGATAATGFTVNSATQITATAPAGTGTVDVRITTTGGTSATSASDQFTYIAAPTVTALSPTSGPTSGGTSVNITGTNFSGATAVTFGATAATGFTVNSATQITATAPAGTGTVDVRITTTGGTSATSANDQFTYIAAPTVTALSPTSGPTGGGTSVTITGTNFSGATAVTFGATAATGFTVNSATQIMATAPAGTGTVDVRITTTGGTSVTSANDQFTYVVAPTVTALSPTSGPTGGGTSVTITGTNFSGATAVTFGATAATGFTVNSATQITATAPAGTGTVDVRITTTGGTSAISASDQFTYAAPTASVTSITRLTPSPTATGTVSYRVVFSSVVTGISSNNFSLTTTGLASASVTNVSGSGSTYTVTVNTGNGDGTIRLNLANSTGLSPSISNAPYSSGEIYTITKSFASAPTLRIEAAGSASGNSDVTAFVDQLQVLASGSVTPIQNGILNSSFETNNVAPSNYLYQSQGVVASPWSFGVQAGVSRNNSVFGSIAANGDAVAFLQSTAGNNGAISQNLAVPTGTYQIRFYTIQRNYTSLDQRLRAFINGVYIGEIQPNNVPTYDIFTSAAFSVTAPALTATISSSAGASGSTTSTSPIPFSVSFSQGVGTSFTGSDVNISGGTLTTGSFSGSGAGPYTFTVIPGGNGTVSVSLASGVAIDANNTGNSASATYSLNYSQASITPSAATFPSALSTTYGTASTSTSVTVSGTGLSTGITATPFSTSNFEVSADNVSYSSSVTIGSSGTIYVRLKANAPAGTNITGNVTLTSSNASSQTVSIPSSTVAKATLTYTANTLLKVYGDAVPALSGTVTGFVNSETISTATTGTLSWSTSALANSNVGSYDITGTGLSANNYDFVQAASNATALTITPKAITVTAAAKSKTYGDADPALTYTFASALVTGDSFSGSLTRVPGENVGTYAINQGTLAPSSNYTVTYVGADLTIGAKAITITAAAKSKTYGDADPALTYTFAPALVTGDSFSGSLTRTPGENIDTYAINQGTLALNGNYSLTYVGADLTITPKAITVTAAAKSKTYGDADPALTYTFAPALATGDSFSGSLTRVPGENVGTYAINQGTLALNGNYSITYVIANLSIGAKTITVTAAAKSKTYGDADPALTYTFAPALVGTDTFTGSLTRTPGENVGTYAINQGTLALNGNYSLTYVGADLTIGAKTITVTAAAKSKTYGDADPALTYTFAPALVTGDSFSGSLTRTPGENVGTYAINQGTLALNGNYSLTYVGADLTIGAKTITVTAAAKSKTYGDADPALTYTFAPALVTGDSFSGSLTRTPGENVGTYAINQGTLALNGNYSLTYVGADLTIGAKTITVTAAAKSKTYGDADPVLTYTFAPALVGTDTFTGNLTRTPGKNVGTYAINQGTLALNGNYSLTYVGADLTIGAKTITVTAEAKSKTYGDADPALTYTFAPALVTGDSFSGSLTRTPGENVGTYAINQGTLALNGNYNLTYVGADLTIGAKTITVTAAAKSKTYGDADPALTYTFAPALVTSDSFSGSLTRTPGENVGTYAINQGTLALNGNYSLTYVGADLTIGAKTITVTAAAKSKTYGDADPALTYTFAPALATGDSFSGSLTRLPGENVGTYAINQGTLELNGNYNLTYVGADLTIGAKTITVTAAAKSKTYGDADPALTYTFAPALATGDSFSGSLTRVPGENVGTYAINQGTLALSSNYTVTYVGADLTIGAKAITITAAAKSKTYGDADPALTYTFAPALVTGDSFTGSLTRTPGENVGTYAINQGTLAPSSNYTVTYVSADLTIGAKAITVTAAAKSKTYGDADPALTYTFAPALVGTDTFTGSLTRTPGENVGTYAINQGTLALNGNYSLTYVGADLTITPKAITVTAAAKSKTYGDADPALTYTFAPALAGTDTFTGSLTRTPGENVGTYAINQGTLALNGNYSLTYVGADLTIGAKTITVTAAAKSKTYGDADPVLTYTFAPALVGTDTFTGNLTRTPGENVGTYAINQGTLALNGNYSLTYVGADLTIGAKTITVTAAAKSKTYGDADPALTYTFAPALVGTDTFTGSLTRTPGENVGTYAINQGTLALNGNYSLTYVGADLTIGAKTITVTAAAKSKTYGDADPALTYTFAPALVGTDIFTGSLTRTPGENVGTYAINQGTLALNGNYSLTYVGADLTIGAKAITVTAAAKSKTYGDADPALTYTFAPALVGTDIFTGSLTRTPGENVGTYAINQGTLALNGNYSLTYVGADLTIGAKAITVTAAAKSKTYGDADPALTYTFAPALVGTDTFTGSLTRTPGENVGTYAINQGTLAISSNYTVSYVGADLTIGAKTITVTAAAKSKTYGDADPALTYTFTPALATGDSFSGSLTRAPGENVGTYAINQGTLALNGNYTIAYISSNLTITKSVLTVTANNAVMCQSDGFPTFGITYTGFKTGDNESALSIKPIVSTTANRNVAGNYVLVASGGAANNYSLVYVNGTLTINAIPLVNIVSNKGTEISKGETAVLTASGGTAYSWSTASGIISGQNTASLSVRPVQTTIYTVRVTNASGCNSSASITIKVNEDYKLVANNILTPNGDGINDTWIIQNIDLYPSNEVRIFDRNGREMYSKKSYDNSWNGTIGGNELAEGTYYYIITYGPNKLVQKGFITIIRNR
ncbi:MBG domain-containing protein [Pedobacter terrae]|uniref:MBG domain-containing protein n=1 Tax=Pedobacter terrae TaxID=405671 RepID=UPI002FF90999